MHLHKSGISAKVGVGDVAVVQKHVHLALPFFAVSGQGQNVSPVARVHDQNQIKAFEIGFLDLP